ncbi:ATP cone domain-containing protein [Arenibacter algicola]|uniref:Restriction endonuclease n=1 Tax=Arenibacter algicola TaxID=616991 RepID=A0A221V019_9FLAO|nr:ATP cone domain-containing protein [Arenibacter algicola]ASO06942.1 restriction endonuclease [Arenibacter algicola]|tara:strand:+ start:5389 stop:6234 length:846 start_codon:yes stop_codon:yes gene_type:complete
MKKELEIEILKSSGERAKFSLDKLRKSLKHSGADHNLVEQIVDQVKDELYEGISTNEIYNRAYSLLKKNKSIFASKYKLKKAIYELGPTGFPFERFVAAILEYSGYHTSVDQIMNGICVTHEIDVVAEKNGTVTVIECKFHSEEGRNCNVKIPLYIHSRYNDVKGHWATKKNEHRELDKGWVVTNTRFTSDASTYGKCAGLYLLSWDLPLNDGLKDRIDRLGLYPITVSTLLSNREKQFLLSRDVVLCRQLWKDKFFLDHLGISSTRKEKILNEIKQLCNH